MTWLLAHAHLVSRPPPVPDLVQVIMEFLLQNGAPVDDTDALNRTRYSSDRT